MHMHNLALLVFVGSSESLCNPLSSLFTSPVLSSPSLPSPHPTIASDRVYL